MPRPHSNSKHFKLIGPLYPVLKPSPSDLTSTHPSLKLLCPTKKFRLSPPSSPPCPVSNLPQDATTTAHLTLLSTAILDALRDDSLDISQYHSLIDAHVSPDFHCTQDFEPGMPAGGSVDWTAHVVRWRAALARLPDYGARKQDVLVEVRENGSWAKVWTFKEVTGLPGGVRKEMVTVARWERRGDVWVTLGIDMLRGVGGQ